MAKDSARTALIREALSELRLVDSNRTLSEIRQACFEKLVPADANGNDVRKWKESIRRTVMQMRDSGELFLSETSSPDSEINGMLLGEENETGPIEGPISLPEEQKTVEKSEVLSPSVIPSDMVPENAALTEPQTNTVTAIPSSRESVTEEKAEEKTSPNQPKKVESRPIGIKMPKAKQMNAFLAEVLLSDSGKTQDQLIAEATEHFGATGEQYNGVKGLTVQCLKEQKKRGEVVFSTADGFRKAPIVPIPEKHEAVSEQKPKQIADGKKGQVTNPVPKEPNPEVKKDVELSLVNSVKGKPNPIVEKAADAVPDTKDGNVSVPLTGNTLPKSVRKIGITRITQREPKPLATAKRIEGNAEHKGGSRLIMNENRFAEKINAAGGTFFNEFIARLFEAYYSSHGITVCGRYIVDGADDKGVDVILQTVDELGLGDVVLLQAKTRNSGQVTLKELREFFGVMAAEHATRGVFVTTSTFTTDAVTFIRNNPNLAAVDKYKLFDLASRLKVGIVESGDSLTADPLLFG